MPGGGRAGTRAPVPRSSEPRSTTSGGSPGEMPAALHLEKGSFRITLLLEG